MYPITKIVANSSWNYKETKRCLLNAFTSWFVTAFPRPSRRTARPLVVGKANSIFYAKGEYTDTQAQQIILSNPFKRFEDMQMLPPPRPWA